ncbi:MAG TPA: DUF4118 domain-containing protein [Nocardioidaceae bacterium]|jgi:K+-sensing histidine kinase KdpD|nr:DUF4118 domain-containing protein [Nocardioidaceae bacterium]
MDPAALETEPRVPPERRTRGWLVAVGAAVPFAVAALLSPVRESVTVATVSLLLVVVVVAVSASGHRVAGLVAALSGGAWFDFFFTQPYGSFTIADADDVEVTVLLVAIGALVGELALWGRRQQRRASVREGYLEGVLQAAELISLHDQPVDVLAASVGRQIAEVLGVPACRFVARPTHDPRNAVLARNGSVTRNGHPVDVDRHGLPVDEDTVLLVRRGAEVLGHFVLTSASETAYPTLEQRKVAVLLADQVAAALTRR